MDRVVFDGIVAIAAGVNSFLNFRNRYWRRNAPRDESPAAPPDDAELRISTALRDALRNLDPDCNARDLAGRGSNIPTPATPVGPCNTPMLDLSPVRLGCGFFGVVFKGYYTPAGTPMNTPVGEADMFHGITAESERTTVAVKMLHNPNCVKSRADILREAEVMKQLGSNAHIISIKGEIDNMPVVITEYCARGNLLEYLQMMLPTYKEAVTHVHDYLQTSAASYQNTRMKLVDLISFAWQVSDGMKFISSKGFIHRDLAARNIFLTFNKVVKIADFGMCRLAGESVYVARSDCQLPWRWSAPESFARLHFSTKSDVWSYGVLLYEIFSAGGLPYGDISYAEDLEAYLNSGKRLEQPVLCPVDVYHLMLCCWSESASDRPTFAYIKQYFGKCLEVLLEGHDNHPTQFHRRDGNYAPLRPPPLQARLSRGPKPIGNQRVHENDRTAPQVAANDAGYVRIWSDGYETPKSIKRSQPESMDAIARMWLKEDTPSSS